MNAKICFVRTEETPLDLSIAINIIKHFTQNYNKNNKIPIGSIFKNKNRNVRSAMNCLSNTNNIKSARS